MGMCWILLTLWTVYSIIGIGSGSPPETTVQDDVAAARLLGFKPCLDENCNENYISGIAPVFEGSQNIEDHFSNVEDNESNVELLSDNPTMHCLMLRPSVVKAFGQIESRFPDISFVKYKVLEEVMAFATLYYRSQVNHCNAEVTLLDLIILSAMKLKQHYLNEVGDNCEYRDVSEIQPEGTNVDPLMKRSQYISEEFPEPCPGDTCMPKVATGVPINPCHESTTSQEEKTERPCSSTSTPKTDEPCPGATSIPKVATGTPINPCYESTTESGEEATERPCSSTSTPKTDEPCPGATSNPKVATGTPMNPCYESTTESGEEATERPCSSTSTPKADKSCLEETTETHDPCSEDETEGDYGDHPDPYFVGSIRGIPGIHFPNYTDVPISSFSCADKKIPGFYADLETGCQVFHVCYEHRRESFLCPVGTIFNQPILACDYWYSSNCSLAPVYYDTEKADVPESGGDMEDIISIIINGDASDFKPGEKDMDEISKFLPVKAKVMEFPDVPKMKYGEDKPKTKDVEDVASDIFDKIVRGATRAASKGKDVIRQIPEPDYKYKPIKWDKPDYKYKPIKMDKPDLFPSFKIKPLSIKAPLTKAAMSVGKAKLAAIPAAKATAAIKASVPLFAKAKLKAAAVPVVAAKTKVVATLPVAKAAAVKAKAIPIAKAKIVAAAVPPAAAKAKLTATIPKVFAKAAVPVLKTKMIASALPLAKAKLTGPVLKGKAFKAAAVPIMKAMAIPLVKSKFAGSVPLVKAKLAKAAVISPLTKKALALGYMKLLKAKKLALMG